MSEAADRLRKADEERLKSVVAALRHGGRFVVIVAEEKAWPGVTEVLRAKGVAGGAEMPEVRLSTGEEVIAMFASPIVGQEGIVVLRVEEAAAEAMQTLNLHREKLGKQACCFALWLVGGAAYERFVREAPDCYSVRDGVAVLEGRPETPPVLGDLSEEIEHVRREVAANKDPDTLVDLADRLYALDLPEEAHRALDRGIVALESRNGLHPDERLALAWLHHRRGDSASQEVWRAQTRSALRALDPVRSRFEGQYALFLAGLNDAYGYDLAAVRQAIHLTERSVTHPIQLPYLYVLLAQSLSQRGDVCGARRALARAKSGNLGGQHERHLELIEADVCVDEGRWREAERDLQRIQVASAESHDWVNFISAARKAGGLLAQRGEAALALDILAAVTSESVDDLRAKVQRSRAEPDAVHALSVPLTEGLMPSDTMNDALKSAHEKGLDIRKAVEAGLLPETRGEQLDQELEALAAQVATTAPDDPPWTRILMALVLADDLLAHTRANENVASSADRGLSLARDGAHDLIPECVRRLAVARLRSGNLDGLLPLFEEAFSAAETHHLLGEAARLSGLRFWLATRLGEGVAKAETALHAAIDRTGSVLIEAEVLAKAGRATGRRDLLERARRIYRSLPWPEREAECLEALGMKDAAIARLEAFDLRLAALAMRNRTEPPPIGT